MSRVSGEATAFSFFCYMWLFAILANLLACMLYEGKRAGNANLIARSDLIGASRARARQGRGSVSYVARFTLRFVIFLTSLLMADSDDEKCPQIWGASASAPLSAT